MKGMDMVSQNDQGGAPLNAPTKECKKCHSTIPKYADKCPQCGANLKPVYKKAWFWIPIVLVLLILMVGGCSAACTQSVNDSKVSGGTEVASSQTTRNWQVSGEELNDKGYGLYSISGTFTSSAKKQLSYVQLEYVLKDEEGNQIGTAYANTSNLDPNTAWKFEATCFSTANDAVPASYELKEVTGY